MEYKPGDIVVVANRLNEIRPEYHYKVVKLTRAVTFIEDRLVVWYVLYKDDSQDVYSEDKFKRLTEFTDFERLVLGLEEHDLHNG